MITFKRGDVIKLPLKRKKNSVYLAPEIAQQIIPREVQPGMSVSTLTGCLQVKDNLHDIKVYSLKLLNILRSTKCELLFTKLQAFADRDDQPSSSKRPPTREEVLKNIKYEWGKLDVDLFVKKLMQDGITDIKIEQTGPGGVIIKLLGEDTSITINEHNTHIKCGGKQSLRLKLRDLLLQCVPSF